MLKFKRIIIIEYLILTNAPMKGRVYRRGSDGNVNEIKPIT